MGKEILVVFGSASDSVVFEPLMNALKAKGISSELRICSAHRTPKMLEKIILGSKAKIVIAGAGLSAALPGVIASQTLKPVIGIPVENNFSGLDSLLSVHQMPPGIPVLGVGVNAAEEAANAAQVVLQKRDSIKIIKNFSSEKFEKKFLELRELLKQFNAKFVVSDAIEGAKENEVIINFVNLNSEQETVSRLLAINVPLLEKDSALDAQKLLEKTKKCLWVGLNRFENAGLAALEILAISEKKFVPALKEHRKKGAAKVISADAEQSKKWGDF